MTLTLLCSTAAESFSIENQIIIADSSIEILNPYHEDPVIYASRMPDPDNMVKRTIVRLVCMSDMVLNLSGQNWIDGICGELSIPVYHALEEIMSKPDSPVEIPELVVEEVWCGGCRNSKMNPLKNPMGNSDGYNVRICSWYSQNCPTYKSFEDAINGEDQIKPSKSLSGIGYEPVPESENIEYKAPQGGTGEVDPHE